MLKNFRTFHDSVAFYRQVAGLRMPTHLKSQLLRASSSICLNLSEGAGKTATRDQRRFFEIAMGSLRESQAILFLALQSSHPAVAQADRLAASLYRLLNPKLI
jgi:four helix bundle protein